MINSIKSFPHVPRTTINDISSRLSRNSEANASEFLRFVLHAEWQVNINVAHYYSKKNQFVITLMTNVLIMCIL